MIYIDAMSTAGKFAWSICLYPEVHDEDIAVVRVHVRRQTTLTPDQIRLARQARPFTSIGSLLAKMTRRAELVVRIAVPAPHEYCSREVLVNDFLLSEADAKSLAVAAVRELVLRDSFYQGKAEVAITLDKWLRAYLYPPSSIRLGRSLREIQSKEIKYAG